MEVSHKKEMSAKKKKEISVTKKKWKLVTKKKYHCWKYMQHITRDALDFIGNYLNRSLDNESKETKIVSLGGL